MQFKTENGGFNWLQEDRIEIALIEPKKNLITLDKIVIVFICF